ncbi:hypothetical protein EVAR_65332_1 [Eumeta japonica]|uniref:Rhodanese domain-containing protein n=1 Tax=Eumeta variegata TaxID=151549 RepID=A0A4C1YV68_EUMVA|nr:hypothetical protein EVAR_65332_1 [Eumeta japonica]
MLTTKPDSLVKPAARAARPAIHVSGWRVLITNPLLILIDAPAPAALHSNTKLAQFQVSTESRRQLSAGNLSGGYKTWEARGRPAVGGLGAASVGTSFRK